MRHRITHTRQGVWRATYLGLAFTRSEQAESGPKMRGADKLKAGLNGLTFKDGILAQDLLPEQQRVA